MKLSWKTDLIVQQDNVILRVQDKENHFVQGADVKVTFIRPTQDGYDRHITLNENWSSQMYQSKLNLPLKGQWQANISITKDGFTYHQNQMIIYE